MFCQNIDPPYCIFPCSHAPSSFTLVSGDLGQRLVVLWSSGMNCDKFANVVAVGVTTDLNTDKFRCTQPNPNQTKLYLSLTVLMRHGQVQKHPNLTKLNTCQLSSTDLHMDKFRCIQTKPNYSSFTNLHMDIIGQDRCTLHKPILLFILDQ